MKWWRRNVNRWSKLYRPRLINSSISRVFGRNKSFTRGTRLRGKITTNSIDHVLFRSYNHSRHLWQPALEVNPLNTTRKVNFYILKTTALFFLYSTWGISRAKQKNTIKTSTKSCAHEVREVVQLWLFFQYFMCSWIHVYSLPGIWLKVASAGYATSTACKDTKK